MREISVVVDNHPGILADITEVLASADINIESIDGAAANTHGVIHLAVDRYDDALTVLRDAGFSAITEDALLIALKDESGALARCAARFKNADLNIRSLRIVRRENGYALVTLVTDDNQRAKELVADVLVAPGA